MKGPEDGKDPAELARGVSAPADDGQPTVATPSGAGDERMERPSSEQPATVSEGSVIADRYKVKRFIAQGGMGEVYEVEDLALNARVALKTIRPGMAGDEEVVARFKREIHLARQVTHPNVCRIFDLGMHGGSGIGGEASTDQVLFLTMELLSGPTLSRRIRQKKRLAGAEALNIAVQMAEGLDTAHGIGIIHRDFKSSNVMLVPSPDSRKAERVVITDFGLARGQITGEDLASISETGVVVGTPAYMAPEQVQGLELTPAADIYALGIVLYEMVTGIRPFEGGSALSVAARRLTEPPRSPRESVPDLDPAWEAVILRCLARNADARFASAIEVADALSSRETAEVHLETEETELLHSSGGAAVSVAEDKPAAPRRLPGWAAAAIAMLAVLALGYTAYRAWWPAAQTAMPSGEEAVAEKIEVRPSLAVLSFTNVSGRDDSAWLSTAIGEMLTTELAVGGTIRTVGGETVAQLRGALALVDVNELDSEDLARLRRSLGVDYVTLGSYTLVGGEDPLLRVDLRLVDLRTGKVDSGGATGTETQIFDLVNRASEPLRKSLGLGELAPAQVLEARAILPSDREAARLYTEGLDRLRRHEFVKARDLLERATAADPEHPMPHASLAVAWSALGHDRKAEEAASKAVALSAGLPHRQRLEIEGLYHGFAKDWTQAAEIFRGLFHGLPDDVDIGIRLAAAQRSAGLVREAMVTLDALRRLPSPISDDPRIDLMEQNVRFSLGDYSRVKELTQIIEGKAEASGADLYVARAKAFYGSALQAQGEYGESMSVLREAKALYDREGDQRGAAISLETMGLTVWYQGDLDGAERLLERSLEIYRDLGFEARVAPVLMNLGMVALDQGRLSEAEQLFDEALAASSSVGATRETAAALQNLGVGLQLGGELAAARKRYREAMDICAGFGERSCVAMSLTNIAEVFFLEGELNQAWEMHGEALAINREIGDESGAAYDTYRMALVAFEKGDEFVAAQLLEEALAAQESMDEKLSAAETRLGLARLELDRGNAERAEELAGQAEQVFRTESSSDQEALARTVLAHSSLALGRLQDARGAAARVAERAADSEDRRVELDSGMLQARVRAASDAGDEELRAAVKELEQIAGEAERAGFVIYAFEARLAASQVQLAGGGAERARAALLSLADEAGARGLGRIANKARALLS